MRTREMTMPPSLKTALSQRFRRIVVFSGAGMSAESGIPTFRSGANGLWDEFDPAQLATPDAWRKNRDLVWGWYEWRRGLVMTAQPNPGHHAVAWLQQQHGASLITQNVDDLHERAGARVVLHLHGSLFRPHCDTCRREASLHPPPTAAPRELAPPVCRTCHGHIRPGVVWFGESLDQSVLTEATRQIADCDLLLIVGTSGIVAPAAGLVTLAPESAVLVEINPHPPPPRHGILQWATTAALGLPEIARTLG